MPIDLSFVCVLIKGAGDLASGVALRLHRSGISVVMTETAYPLVVRRTVAFASAIFDAECQVEEVTAVRCDAQTAPSVLAHNRIAVIQDPEAHSIQALAPAVVVDAIMAKRNTGTHITDAPLVIALGPGFTAGVDCHAVIETNRGHNLGRVLWAGSAEPDTGTPGELTGTGKNVSRVLRAPVAGHVFGLLEIGDSVAEGGVIATVAGHPGSDIPPAEVIAPFSGVLRGLIHPTVFVERGMKIGDLDPRADAAYCYTVSDKSLAIGGAVLEAVLCSLKQQKKAN